MRVLAADTSTPYCSVALCDCSESDSHVLAETTVQAGRRHSELLLSIARDVLNLSGARLSDVDLLAISTGPGSFTGLRVGVATWKGLAFGMQLPLAGVPTLDAMARRLGAGGEVAAPILDARMQEVFAAAYRFRPGAETEVLMPATVEAIEDVLARLPAGAIVFGDGALRYRSAIEAHANAFVLAPPEFHYPAASTVAIEGFVRAARGESTDAAAVVPVYLRKSQAEEARDASEAPVA